MSDRLKKYIMTCQNKKRGIQERFSVWWKVNDSRILSLVSNDIYHVLSVDPTDEAIDDHFWFDEPFLEGEIVCYQDYSNFEILLNNFKIRRINEDDAFSIQKHVDDQEIAKFANIHHPYTIQDAYEFIERANNEIDTWISYQLWIEDNMTWEIVWMIWFIDYDEKNKNAEVAYWLWKEYQWKWIMTNALKEFMKLGFNHFWLKKIYARTRSDNDRWLLILKKLWFKLEWRLKEHIFSDWEFIDEFIYWKISKK